MRQDSHFLRSPLVSSAALFFVSAGMAQRGQDPGSVQFSMSRPAAHGRVLLEDKQPPPGPVTIRRICGAEDGISVGVTDSRGYFNIREGSYSPALPDATSQITNNRVSAVSSYAVCDLEAQLTGYLPVRVSMKRAQMYDRPAVDLGTLILKRQSGQTRTGAPATGGTASKKAGKPGRERRP
jgi:hypothetical protein